MIEDIRLSLSFFRHRKIKKLQRTLGIEGTIALLRLWITVANEHPSGQLSDWDVEDFTIAADYNGEPDEFVATLVKLRLLDMDEQGYYFIHNWSKRQQWVANANQRSFKARLSRMAKTHNSLYKKLISQGYTGITRDQYDELTAAVCPVNVPLSPSPDPDPSPVPSPDPNPSPSECKIATKITDKIIDYLNNKAVKKFSHSEINRKPITSILNQKYTIEDCQKVIDNKIADPDFPPKYLQPSTLFNKSKFENYLNQCPAYKKNKTKSEHNFSDQDYQKGATTDENLPDFLLS